MELKFNGEKYSYGCEGVELALERGSLRLVNGSNSVTPEQFEQLQQSEAFEQLKTSGVIELSGKAAPLPAAEDETPEAEAKVTKTPPKR